MLTLAVILSFTAVFCGGFFAGWRVAVNDKTHRLNALVDALNEERMRGTINGDMVIRVVRVAKERLQC